MILVVVIFFILLFFLKNKKEKFIEIEQKPDLSSIVNVNINEDDIHDVVEFNKNIEKDIFNESLNSKQNIQLLRLKNLKKELENQSLYVDKLRKEMKTVQYNGAGEVPILIKTSSGKLGDKCGVDDASGVEITCDPGLVCIPNRDNIEVCSIKPETPSDVFRHVNNFYIDSEGSRSNFLKLSNKLFKTD